MVEVGDDAGQVAGAVAVGIREGTRVDLVDGRAAPPRLGGIARAAARGVLGRPGARLMVVQHALALPPRVAPR